MCYTYLPDIFFSIKSLFTYSNIFISTTTLPSLSLSPYFISYFTALCDKRLVPSLFLKIPAKDKCQCPHFWHRIVAFFFFNNMPGNASLPSPPFLHSSLCGYWVGLTTWYLFWGFKWKYLFSNPYGGVHPWPAGCELTEWRSGELNSWYTRDRFMQLQSRGPISY